MAANGIIYTNYAIIVVNNLWIGYSPHGLSMLDIYYNMPGIIILNIMLKYVCIIPAPLYSNKPEVSE